MEKQMVVFQLSNEHYGVDIASVDSIIRMQAVTAMPLAPDFCEGVTNLRGTVLPVIDLRKRFGLPSAEATKETRIVVTETNDTMVGMMVDAVIEVQSIPESDIEPPSPLVTTVDSAFIAGIAKAQDERLTILLDLDRVLSREEQAELQGI
jgi:purine-binding chemotaxis protein CheW